MNPQQLLQCVTAVSCVITQTSSGLISGALLFLVAAGLTLIFGVLRVVNFTHGAFYMLGAYVGLTTYAISNSYFLAVVAAGLAVAVFGVVFDRIFMSRVYDSDVLMQLLVCFAFILILNNAVRLVWGPEFHAMGIPKMFQVPPLFILGGVIPVFYVVLVAITAFMAFILWYVLERTLIGKMVRAVAYNPTMASTLGINTNMVYAAVFACGGLLAGVAGALAAPVRSASPGMGASILITSFLVTVIGGMGSIGGALVASLMLGMIRSYGSIGFPNFVEELMFLVMVFVLVLRPNGLMGRNLA